MNALDLMHCVDACHLFGYQERAAAFDELHDAINARLNALQAGETQPPWVKELLELATLCQDSGRAARKDLLDLTKRVQ